MRIALKDRDDDCRRRSGHGAEHLERDKGPEQARRCAWSHADPALTIDLNVPERPHELDAESGCHQQQEESERHYVTIADGRASELRRELIIKTELGAEGER